jgi:thermosome
MLVDTLGDVVITNDGVTILSEMEIQHPTAKMMVEVSKAQQEEIGDGTTTAVVIAGELLKRAGDLIEQSIHPTVIIKGYRMADHKARDVLKNIGIPVTIKNTKKLHAVATTAMTGKGVEGSKEHLADIAVESVRLVSEKEGTKYRVDKDSIKIEKREGGSVIDTALIRGVVLDKERAHSGMPRTVRKARIALVDSALEIKNTETKAEIRITDPTQLEAFLHKEERIIKEMVDAVVATGANVLLCQKGIDDLAQHYLAKVGIFAVRRVKKSDMKMLANATSARIVTNIKELAKGDLGYAEEVEETKIAGDEMVLIQKCKNPKAASVIVRGGTKHVTEEAEKALEDAIDDVAVAVKDGRLVAGGGASEVEMARRLREYAGSVGGREQLAINAFADGLESCPRALAENAGLDPTDKLVALRKAHTGKKGIPFGLNVFTGKVVNMNKAGVLEPLGLKLHAIKAASEVAEMVLRIDDIVLAKELGGGGGGMPPGMPPGGMGGMPGMM